MEGNVNETKRSLTKEKLPRREPATKERMKQPKMLKSTLQWLEFNTEKGRNETLI
jgi:hypothetical protein